MRQTQDSSLPDATNVTRVVLPNGLTILVRENHTTPVAVLQGAIPAGVLHDTPEEAGLAAFVASMLTRGSEHYDFASFNETIESVGGNLTVSADTHSTDVSITCLSEDFAQLIAVLADIVQRPAFPTDHVERLRRQRLVRLQERDQDTANVANLRFYEALYGREHPYGRATSGYTETVRSLTRDDLVSFHQRHFTPHGAIFAIAGAVETSSVIGLLEQQFGEWQGARALQDVPALTHHRSAERIVVPMPGKVQADFVTGAYAVARSHPDYYALRVANCILGQFGMMGRLGANVRDDQGLAYYCYSALMAERGGGVWMAAAGVNPEDLEQAVSSVLAEFARLGDEAVDAAELEDSQAYLTGVIPLTLETNDGVASSLLSIEWHELGLDYLHRYPDLIFNVTAADVQRVARTYLRPEQCVTVTAGPLA